MKTKYKVSPVEAALLMNSERDDEVSDPPSKVLYGGQAQQAMIRELKLVTKNNLVSE